MGAIWAKRQPEKKVPWSRNLFCGRPFVRTAVSGSGANASGARMSQRRKKGRQGGYNIMSDEKQSAAPAAPTKSGADILGPSGQIGRKLREQYEDVLVEGVPDRFLDLLKQLDQAESGRKAE